MNRDDEVLSAAEEELEARLRAVATAVEQLPPWATAERVRGAAERSRWTSVPRWTGQIRQTEPGGSEGRAGAPGSARARRRVPLVAKAAVLVFVALVVATGTLVALNVRGGPHGATGGTVRGTSGGHPPTTHVPAVVPDHELLAGDSSPCAGEPPGCGSPESSAAALAAGSWSSFPTGPLSERTGQVEVWTGSELVIWGGASSRRSSDVLGDGAAYDPATGSWRMLPPSPLPPREDAAAAWDGTEMIVVGGDNGPPDGLTSPGTVFGDAAAYDPTTNAWTALPASPLGPLADATAIWAGQQLVLIGGSASGVTGSPLDAAAAYDPASDTWTTLPPMPVLAGWSASALTPAWTGKELLVWVTWLKSGPCGSRCDYEAKRDVGYALPAGAGAWRTLGKPSTETDTSATAWTGSAVLVMGGTYCPWSCPSPPIGHGSAYDPATASWQPVSNFSVGAGQWPAVWTGLAFVDDNLGSGGHYVPGASDRLSAYDPSSGAWRALPPAPHEDTLYRTPAIWTGSQLLVWGPQSEALTAR